MLNLRNAHAQIALFFVGTLLCLLTLVTPNAEAKKRPRKPLPTDIQIVGHSGLGGVRGHKMFLQEQQGRWYLYAARASEHGFTIIDVTDPTDPKVIKSVTAQDPGSSGTLQIADKFAIWDLTDPVNPKALRQFSEVTGVLVDERKCAYVMDKEGLSLPEDPQPYVPFPYGPDDPYPNGQDLYHG